MLREKILDILENRGGFEKIREHIEVEKIITPNDWEESYNVYLGAVFNLEHQLNQVLWRRPRNRFEEIKNCYLVGGGTHPGGGLATIFESGRITAELILQDSR